MQGYDIILIAAGAMAYKAVQTMLQTMQCHGGVHHLTTMLELPDDYIYGLYSYQGTVLAHSFTQNYLATWPHMACV